jgi:hypothetical protein
MRQVTHHYTCSALSLLSLLLLFRSSLVTLAGNGGLPGFNTTTPYLIYYGTWNSTQVDFARRNYRLVILDAHNITAAQVATIKRGPDNVTGTADDVRVFGYVSVGEDNRPGGPFVGDGLGPRVDPRSSDSVPLSSITNALGLPSPGGIGYASYYLDTKSSPDGVPDQNTTFGGYYINAGAPAWWTVLKNMTIATDGNAGLDEILTGNVGKGLNCDGLFLDTIDTCAPNSFGATTYEWTTPGMQGLVHRINTNYPTKLIMANRGLFFFNPNYKHYAYTLRPYIHLLMFESYYTDSNNSDQVNPFFADNKYDYAPKLNAEAGRPDGFTIVALGYDHTPALPQQVITQDYIESMGVQGWPLYRTDPALSTSFNTNAMSWLSTNADTAPPVWDSTAAQSATPPAPRVGIQQAKPGDQCVTVFWDVARDQTEPVRYNVYYTSQPTLNFSTASKLTHVAPSIPGNYLNGTGPGIYAYQYTVTGLSNGMGYLFAVRAEDSASPSHEDANTVTLSAVPGAIGAAGTFRNMTIDGDFSDWAGIPWLYQGAPDTNVVNFANVQFANDANYLYGHFTLYSSAAPFSDYNTHLFIDRDGNQQTGYQVSGGLFGSELMVEGSTGYDQRNGSFNAGTVPSLVWTLAPSGSNTEFEFRVSLAAAYADSTKVFTTNMFRLMLEDNRGNEVATATGIPYVLAPQPPSTYSHISVDGSFNDWANVPIVATAPTNGSGFSFANCSIANDNDYLYVRFSLHSAAAPFSDINTHVFIDTDNNAATGYHPSSTTIGSDLMIESGVAYDERSGSFAAGTVSGIDWLLAPGGSSTNFELRMSRLARYADNSLVFTNPTIRIVLADNRGSLMTAAGIPYTWAWGGPYEDWRAFYFTPAQLANPAVSGDGADASGDGIANIVKYAFNLNPLVVNHPSLPRGQIENFGGSNYLDVTFLQRNPPAGVQYIPQVSSNLTTWDSSPSNFTQVSSIPDADGISQVTLRLQPAIGVSLLQRFVRIGISR